MGQTSCRIVVPDFTSRSTVRVICSEPDPGAVDDGLNVQPVFAGRPVHPKVTVPENPGAPETVREYDAGVVVVSVPTAPDPDGAGNVKSAFAVKVNLKY